MLESTPGVVAADQRIVFRPRNAVAVRQFVTGEYARGTRRFALISKSPAVTDYGLASLSGVELIREGSTSDASNHPARTTGIILVGDEDDWVRQQLRLLAAHRRVHICAPSIQEQTEGRPVFVQSIPKSGTHLLFECLKAMRFEPPPSLDLPQPNDNFHPRRFYNLQHLRFADIASPLQKATPFLAALASGVIVFIVRDPRDIAVSMAHYLARQPDYHLLAAWMRSRSAEERLECVLKGEYPMPVYINRHFQFEGTIRDLVLAYSAWIHSPLPNVHFVSFEDLIGTEGGGSAERQLQALWELQLALLVEGSPSDFAAQLFSQKSLTFRRGKIGSYREEFSAEHEASFRGLPQDFMEMTGYSMDREPHECQVPRNPGFQGRVNLPVGAPYLVETQGHYNIVYHDSRFFTVPHDLGEIDVRTQGVDLQKRIVASRSMAAARMAIPTLAKFSLVERNYCGFDLFECESEAIALSAALGTVDLAAVDAAKMNRWKDEGLCLHAASSRALKEALLARPPRRPEAEAGPADRRGEEGVGDNSGWYHAFAANVGRTVRKTCGPSTYARLRECFPWFVSSPDAMIRASSLDDACHHEEGIPGYNVLVYRGWKIALSESLGNVDLPHIPDFLLQRWKAAQQCFLAGTREELWQAVCSALPANPAGQLCGWTMWRFLNQWFAVAEGLSFPETESGLRELCEQGLCVVSKDFDPLREAILGRIPPRLVEAGFQGFNLVEHRLEFFALSEVLGPVDLTSLSDKQTAEWQALGQFFRASSLEELWLDVLLHEPRLLKELPGFNVVNCHGRIVALSKALGPVNLQHVHPETQADWGARGLWIEAARLEDIASAIEAQHRRWLSTNRHGWDVFAYGGRIWAVPHGELGGPVESVTDDRLDLLSRQGKCLWAASEPALELLCLQRRTEDLASQLQEMRAAHQQLRKRWVLRLERGATRVARIPRRLAAAGWRRVSRRLFSL